MKQTLSIALSVAFVYALVILINKRFKKPSRYERSPRTLTPWNALDNGIDPSDEDLT
ncbi:unannotated protein [freshwater metagenome]|uniref:Unannotated protein n=1 Tax=freshwater metagenome TaxID=449393 RepID=A0A6J7IMD0_9ZZZZ